MKSRRCLNQQRANMRKGVFKYDLTGKRFGRLLVLDFGHQKQGKGRFWRCRCDCGSETLTRSGDLRRGDTRSCGCIHREQLVARNATQNGLAKAHWKAYQAWCVAIKRCDDVSNKNYGGRGITVCLRWRTSFAAFLQDMGDPPIGLTLDRKKNNKGYSKANCHWTTPRNNSNNRRNTKFLVYNNERKPLSYWVDAFEIDIGTLNGRLTRGWSPEQALTTPLYTSRWEIV